MHAKSVIYEKSNFCNILMVLERPSRGPTARKRAVCKAPSPQVEAALVMAALCNRAGHYAFVMWFLLLSFYLSSCLFSSPNLSRRRLDVCHTFTHGVALVRI